MHNWQTTSLKMCASPLLVLDRPLWYAGERLLPLDQLLRQLGHVLPVALAPPVAQEPSRSLRFLKGRALRSPSPRTRGWQVVRLFGSQLLPRVDQRVQEQVAVLETQRHAGFCFLISGFNCQPRTTCTALKHSSWWLPL